jgi:hypothetical protein
MIDNKIIYFIGALVVANIGTILTVIIYAGRAVWFLSALNQKVNKNTEDVNNAHSKIRDIEKTLSRSHS